MSFKSITQEHQYFALSLGHQHLLKNKIVIIFFNITILLDYRFSQFIFYIVTK